LKTRRTPRNEEGAGDRGPRWAGGALLAQSASATRPQSATPAQSLSLSAEKAKYRALLNQYCVGYEQPHGITGEEPVNRIGQPDDLLPMPQRGSACPR
jgi:hypothetical protein